MTRPRPDSEIHTRPQKCHSRSGGGENRGTGKLENGKEGHLRKQPGACAGMSGVQARNTHPSAERSSTRQPATAHTVGRGRSFCIKARDRERPAEGHQGTKAYHQGGTQDNDRAPASRDGGTPERGCDSRGLSSRRGARENRGGAGPHRGHHTKRSCAAKPVVQRG